MLLMGCEQSTINLTQREFKIDIDGDNTPDQIVREVLENGRRLLRVTKTTGSTRIHQFARFDHFASGSPIFSEILYANGEKYSELMFLDPTGSGEVTSGFIKSKPEDQYRPMDRSELESLRQQVRSVEKYAEAVGKKKVKP